MCVGLTQEISVGLLRMPSYDIEKQKVMVTKTNMDMFIDSQENKFF